MMSFSIESSLCFSKGPGDEKARGDVVRSGDQKRALSRKEPKRRDVTERGESD